MGLNQNSRQMVHLVLDDLGREPREFQRLRLEIHVLEFHWVKEVLKPAKKKATAKK